MRQSLLVRLRDASLDKFYVPERDIDWSAPFCDDGAPALPDPVVSLYGHARWAGLSRQQRSRLARHEVASMFSATVRFESVLNANFADIIRRSDPLDPTVPYFMHVIEEEARHNRMFVRVVEAAGVGSYPLSGAMGVLENRISRLLRHSRALLYLSVLGVEEITDWIFARCLEAEETHPVVREVCRIHRIEEARHMAFGHELLTDAYRRAGGVERSLVRVAAPGVLNLIFDLLVHPSVYQRSGIVGSRRSARRLWREARRTPHRRELRQGSVSRIATYLERIGVLDPRSRRIWQAAGLLAA